MAGDIEEFVLFEIQLFPVLQGGIQLLSGGLKPRDIGKDHHVFHDFLVDSCDRDDIRVRPEEFSRLGSVFYDSLPYHSFLKGLLHIGDLLAAQLRDHETSPFRTFFLTKQSDDIGGVSDYFVIISGHPQESLVRIDDPSSTIKLQHEVRLIQGGSILIDILEGFFKLRNVSPDCDVFDDVVILIEDWYYGRPHPEGCPVLSSVFNVAPPDLLLLNGAPELGEFLFLHVRMPDDVVRLSDELLSCKSGGFAEFIVHRGDDAVQIGLRDHIGIVDGLLVLFDDLQ